MRGFRRVGGGLLETATRGGARARSALGDAGGVGDVTDVERGGGTVASLDLRLDGGEEVERLEGGLGESRDGSLVVGASDGVSDVGRQVDVGLEQVLVVVAVGAGDLSVHVEDDIGLRSGNSVHEAKRVSGVLENVSSDVGGPRPGLGEQVEELIGGDSGANARLEREGELEVSISASRVGSDRMVRNHSNLALDSRGNAVQDVEGHILDRVYHNIGSCGVNLYQEDGEGGDVRAGVLRIEVKGRNGGKGGVEVRVGRVGTGIRDETCNINLRVYAERAEAYLCAQSSSNEAVSDFLEGSERKGLGAEL